MLSNTRLLEQGNSRIIRWALWLEGFDFYIVYKVGKENYLRELLTREGEKSNNPLELRKFEIGESSLSREKTIVNLCSSCH